MTSYNAARLWMTPYDVLWLWPASTGFALVRTAPVDAVGRRAAPDDAVLRPTASARFGGLQAMPYDVLRLRPAFYGFGWIV